MALLLLLLVSPFLFLSLSLSLSLSLARVKKKFITGHSGTFYCVTVDATLSGYKKVDDERKDKRAGGRKKASLSTDSLHLTVSRQHKRKRKQVTWPVVQYLSVDFFSSSLLISFKVKQLLYALCICEMFHGFRWGWVFYVDTEYTYRRAEWRLKCNWRVCTLVITMSCVCVWLWV